MDIKKYYNRLKITIGLLILSLILIAFNGGFTKWAQGLDLAGGVRLLYLMDFSQYKQNYQNEQQLQQQIKNVLNIVEKNIDSRISKLGVSDYSARPVVLDGKYYMEVEIGGIKDIEHAKEMIGKTVQMTFKVPFSGPVTPEIKKQRQLLAEKILTLLKTKGPQAIQDYVSPPNAWNVLTQQVTLSGEQLKKIFGNDIEKALTTGYVYPKLITSDNSYDIYQFVGKDNKGYHFIKLSVLFKPAWQDAKQDGKLLNGERFKMATVDHAPSGEPAVNIYFDDIGRDMFCKLTQKYINKPMAIFIGNKLVTDPVIRSQICGGVAQITGRYTLEQANKLAEDLNTGAMPVPLKLEQEEKVSPILGEQAFRNALIAGAVGTMLVFLMFWFAYGLRWALITLASLVIFFITLGGFIKAFNVILSLSAIGAILLNIGMAVDANVIIYERIREELKNGRGFVGAVISGYERSIAAIRDGNLTTGLIALLLFLIGTNIFKGFGTMMMIDIFIVLVIMVPAIPGLLLLLGEPKKK